MLKDKLRKILELAERGVDGERNNAKQMLQDLMAKYGVTLEELTSPQVKRYWLRYKYPFERSLILQILGFVLDCNTLGTYKRTAKKAVGIDLTPLQHRTFQEYWDTYRKPLTDEVMKYIDSVFSAYIAKHQLFSSQPGKAQEMTEEEIERLRQVMQGLRPIARPVHQIKG